MKHYFSFFLSVAIVMMCSCSKTIIDPAPPLVDSLELFRNLTDSFSYTIDGQRFDGTSSYGFGKKNAGANLDTVNRSWRWSIDTTQYSINYALGNLGNVSNGYIKINLIKNFKNIDLAYRILPFVKWPTSAAEIQMYALGKHPFAIDFDRHNYQDGIALSVRGPNATSWISYIGASAQSTTSIPYNSQANSVFEVTRLQKLSTNEYDYLVEARFSANIFGAGEAIKKLENGYLRIHIRDY